ncbi:transmembrane protein 106A-like [Genypterus blacodes]|uniref:transmembrane protein 106A-like n=1 Tax=Genypterus blacodes TaxID=154954 RepID=UPI003F76EF51
MSSVMSDSLSRSHGEGAGLQYSGSNQGDDSQPIIGREDMKRWSFSRRQSSGETRHCPACRGTGRMPRGQVKKLVAVISCNDHRLKPRHTKLYIGGSVALCLLVSALALFFLFPRAVLLSPVAVNSSLVHFTDRSVLINITNILNITNQNFVPVWVSNMSVQAVNYDRVVGTVWIQNVSTVKWLSTETIYFLVPVRLLDPEMNRYCKKSSIKVHIMFLHIQMMMTVHHITHSEQLSQETYEFIDCGGNMTVPHRGYPLPPDLIDRQTDRQTEG